MCCCSRSLMRVKFFTWLSALFAAMLTYPVCRRFYFQGNRIPIFWIKSFIVRHSYPRRLVAIPANHFQILKRPAAPRCSAKFFMAVHIRHLNVFFIYTPPFYVQAGLFFPHLSLFFQAY